MKRSKIHIGIIAILICFFSVTISTVNADTPQFTLQTERTGIYPLELTLKPGESLQNEVLIVQNLDENLWITVMLEIGGYAPTEEYQSFNKEWAQFSEKEVTLAPGESKQVQFGVNLPESVQDGLYRGTLTSNLIGYEGQSSTGGLKVVLAVGIKVWLTVDSSGEPTLEEVEVPVVVQEVQEVQDDSVGACQKGLESLRSFYNYLADNLEYVLLVFAILVMIRISYFAAERKKGKKSKKGKKKTGRSKKKK